MVGRELLIADRDLLRNRGEGAYLEVRTDTRFWRADTVDQGGRFIEWSPDSGDVHTANVLRSRDLKRCSIDVDEFIQKAKEMTRNHALDRSAKSAPAQR